MLQPATPYSLCFYANHTQMFPESKLRQGYLLWQKSVLKKRMTIVLLSPLALAESSSIQVSA